MSFENQITCTLSQQEQFKHDLAPDSTHDTPAFNPECYALEHQGNPGFAQHIISSTLDHRIIIIFDLSDPILRDHLHQHSLEVYRQSPLQLVRA